MEGGPLLDGCWCVHGLPAQRLPLSGLRAAGEGSPDAVIEPPDHQLHLCPIEDGGRSVE